MNNKLIIILISFLFLLYNLSSKLKISEHFVPGPPLPYIKDLPINLNKISKINTYRYYVGEGLANSYHTFGFKHSEIKKRYPMIVDNMVQIEILKKFPFMKINKYQIIKNERLVPYLVLVLKELSDYNVKMVQKFNKLQNSMTKIQQKQQKAKAKKHLG